MTIAIALQWILPVIFVSPMVFSDFEYDYYLREGTNQSISVDFCDQNFEVMFSFYSNRKYSLVGGRVFIGKYLAFL